MSSRVKVRVLFQPGTSFFEQHTAEQQLDVQLTVRGKRNGLYRFSVTEILGVLLDELSRRGSLHGIQVPASTRHLQTEYELLRCLAIGTPIGRLDTTAESLELRANGRELLKLVRRRKVLPVRVVGARGDEFQFAVRCEHNWTNAAITLAVMQQLFGTRRARYLSPDYAMCLCTDTTDAYDWMGLNGDSTRHWLQRNSKITRLVELNDQGSSLKWSWFDELYNHLYEVDLRQWRSICLRKRYFSVVNASYLAPSAPEPEQPSPRDELLRLECLSSYDLFNDVLECRLTLLGLLRGYATDEKTFETSVRRIVANIGNETHELRVGLEAMQLYRGENEQQLLDRLFRDQASGLDRKALSVRPAIRAIDKRVRLVSLLGNLKRLLDNGVTFSRSRLLDVRLTNEFSMFARHLFDIRLSRFRLIAPVRIGPDYFLPISLCTGRLMFARLEASPGGTYHVKLGLDRRRILPADRPDGRAAAAATSTAVTTTTTTSTIRLRLEDYVCWSREERNTGGPKRSLSATRIREKSSDRLMFLRGHSGETFRYFSMDPCAAKPCDRVDSIGPANAFYTIIVHDRSKNTLVLHGQGVRGLMLVFLNAIAQTTNLDVDDQAVNNDDDDDDDDEDAEQRTLDELNRCIDTLSMSGLAISTGTESRLAIESAPPPSSDPTEKKSTASSSSPRPSVANEVAESSATSQTSSDNVLTTKLLANYSDLHYVNMLLVQHTGERLDMFDVLEREIQKANLPSDSNTELSVDTINRLLNVMQHIYTKIPLLMNQLLYMQRYDLYHIISNILS